LKRRFLELLEKDLEFRRAVVGMLELERILEGLKRHDEKFEEVLERLDRHEAELVKLREDFNKLGGEVAKLREDMVAGFRRHDEELTKLREDFNKMLGVVVQVQEEQRRLREGYERLEKRMDSLERGLRAGIKSSPPGIPLPAPFSAHPPRLPSPSPSS
jgi:predicted nuclease with TOPRIM domain